MNTIKEVEPKQKFVSTIKYCKKYSNPNISYVYFYILRNAKTFIIKWR